MERCGTKRSLRDRPEEPRAAAAEWPFLVLALLIIVILVGLGLLGLQMMARFDEVDRQLAGLSARADESMERSMQAIDRAETPRPLPDRLQRARNERGPRRPTPEATRPWPAKRPRARDRRPTARSAQLRRPKPMRDASGERRKPISTGCRKPSVRSRTLGAPHSASS